jgi:hypothetical protein
MGCLAAGTWLEADEARLWLGVEETAGRCWRAEALEVEPDESGPARVEQTRLLGAVTRSTLSHVASGARREVVHRTRRELLRVGQRVALRALVALMAFALGAACGGCGDSDVPAILVRDVRYWTLPPDGPRLPAPRAVAVGKAAGAAGEELFVLDTAARVLVFDQDRSLVARWRMPQTQAGNPEAVYVMRDGRIAVADTHYHRVVFFDRSGRLVGTLGRDGRGPGEFVYPVALVQDDAARLYVCEYGSNDRVQKFARDGTFVASFGSFGAGAQQFQRPSDILWLGGRLFVADAINNRILVFDENGSFVRSMADGTDGVSVSFPYDLAVGRGVDGPSLYVVEYGACRVTELSPEGALLGRWGAPGRGEEELATPWGLAVDARGRIIVADTGNRRIVELCP